MITRFCRSVGWQTRSRGMRRQSMRALRDDVRCDLVFDEGDAVTQLQLSFLQPLQHQQIRCRRLMQRVDRRIEIAVLLLQPREFDVEFALILVGHGVQLANKHDEVVNGLKDAAAEISSVWARFARQAGSILTIGYRKIGKYESGDS